MPFIEIKSIGFQILFVFFVVFFFRGVVAVRRRVMRMESGDGICYLIYVRQPGGDV